MTEELSRTRRSIIGFIAVLGIFMAIADGLIISQVYQRNITELETSVSNEARIFANLVSEDLTRGDYSSVESAALNWGSSSTHISSIDIVTANGFELGSYKKAEHPEHWKQFSQTIHYGDNASASIHLTVDTSHIRAYTLTLLSQLIAFSLALIVMLGYVLRRIALRPLNEEIEEHLRTEEQLEKSAHRLKLAKNELEAYSYTLAHDLRTPLRAIISFAQIIKEDSAGKLDEEDLDHLNRIHHAGQHMSALIDDLIQLSRLSQATVKPADCDISAIATALLEQHRQADAEREITCREQPGMRVRGDPKLVEQLLGNLIDNAWKYTRHTANPMIEVGMRRQRGVKYFYVRDNGAGFDMQYVDKLFEPFQRLHTSTEFEGTGIGLASVRRVVQMHNGEIHAEAAPGKGCTITFSLEPGR
ncbi:phospho-acceptor domain-containing protein [Thiogranum longum]|uniref:histidine kinase n=1 Tax=Thiogranum longum TaxID=1537524 RepID=A0A4V6NDB8_9GAMM|nr:ATP-binding protein [Thiogranum longum]TCK18586.1 phospho-acceptor domain-containing protein [Thiogranum longum]